MYEIIAGILKYALVFVVYLFIYSVVKLIYLDISDTKRMGKSLDGALSYLKLIDLQKNLDFKVFESYGIKESATIGRSKKCEVYIADPFLSKEHARIFLKEGAFYIEDLDSTNGTYVNGKKLLDKAVKLKDSDKISFSNVNFLFVDTLDMEGMA